MGWRQLAAQLGQEYFGLRWRFDWPPWRDPLHGFPSRSLMLEKQTRVGAIGTAAVTTPAHGRAGPRSQKYGSCAKLKTGPGGNSPPRSGGSNMEHGPICVTATRAGRSTGRE